MKGSNFPAKRSMNLYYKPDRTTKPATVMLYMLFFCTVMLGLAKVLVYDLWMDTFKAEQERTAAQEQLAAVMQELAGFDEVRDQYRRFSATEEERALTDRMEVLNLLDRAVGSMAHMNTVSISEKNVQIQFSGVTLAQTAQIVKTLEESPLVARTTVNTAATTEGEGAVVQTSVLIELTEPEQAGEEAAES